MDASIQLALMTKAKKVFGSDSTILSFPLQPITFSEAELDFVSSMNVKNLEAFSLLVNLIPQGEAWIPTEDSYLWDIYEDILKGMGTELASSTRTDREETQYQEATRFLRKETEAGLWEDSAAFKTYQQYRDQLFILQETYAAAKSTGEMSQDPAIKNHWTTVEEPKLRQAIQDLETEWVNRGFKHEVEQAQQIRVVLGAKSPFITWSDWCGDFMADIDELTDTDNSQFYPSSFSPINAIADGSWQTFTLTEDEIPAMIAAAPQDLKIRLQSESEESEIVSISFEFSSAKIVRNWMQPEVFQASFWRFTDQNKKLSDGQKPPSGSCPAYTTAVVFGRNITIQKRVKTQNSGSSPSKSTKPSSIAIDSSVFSSINYQTLKVTPIQQTVAIKQPISSQQLQAKPNTAFVAKANLSAAQVAKASPSTQNIKAMNSLKASPTVYQANLNQAQTIRAAEIAQSVQVDLAKELQSANTAQLSDVFRRLQKASIVRPTQKVQIKKPDSGPSKPSNGSSKIVSEQLTGAGEIHILAFICKLLPKCPNPDSSLQW